MTINDIEDALSEQIKQDIDTLKVEPFPDNPDDYLKNLTHPKGAALVQYLGSKYDTPFSLDDIVQDRVMQYMVIVGLRNRRTHKGALAVLEQVRISLTGKIVGDESQSSRKIYPVTDKFLGYDKGIWSYGIIFNVIVKSSEHEECEND